MGRRTHADDTLAGLGWFAVILSVAIGAWLLWPQAEAAPDPFVGGLRVELRPDIAAARDAGHVDAGESDTQVLDQTRAAIRERLARAGVPGARVTVMAGGHLEVRLPAEAVPMSPKTKQAMTGGGPAGAGAAAGSGALAFRIVVEPSTSGRSLWKGDRASFEDWKHGELLRFHKEAVDGVAYAYRDNPVGAYLVPRAGRDAEELWDFLVVKHPATATEMQFGEPMIETPRALGSTDAPTGVAFGIRPRFRRAFQAFTSRHRGRKLAVILDGEVVAVPTITAPIADDLTLRFTSPGIARRMMAVLRAASTAGPLRVRCYYVGETPITGAR